MTQLAGTQYQMQQLTLAPQVANAVTATITTPSPNPQTIPVTASSASAQPNAWTIWYTPLLVGTYTIAWTDQNGTQLRVDTLAVTAPVAASLLTIDECYQTLNLPLATKGANPVFDADILVYAAAATGVVEGIIGPVLPRTITQVFDGGDVALLLGAKPTGILSVSENGTPATDFLLDHAAGLLRAGTEWWNRPFWPGLQNVTVVYTAGTGNPPPNVRLAIREEFRFLWQIGRQGGRSAMSDGTNGDVSVPSGFGIPNRVYELLSSVSSLPGFA